MSINSTTKVCNRCGIEKPTSEFHKRKGYTDDFVNSTCKACMKEYKRQFRHPQKKEEVIKNARTDEVELINILKSEGIFAVSGRSSQFKYTDVVAWGCVPIELKRATLQKAGRFMFKFSVMQKRRGVSAKLVVLAFDTEEGKTYHVFKLSDRIFYDANGNLRTTVTYYPDKGPANQPLFTEEILNSSRNAWHLIEDERKAIIEDIKAA